MASDTRSIDSSELATPFLLIEPLSAVAEKLALGEAVDNRCFMTM